jgi:hypothetical protein
MRRGSAIFFVGLLTTGFRLLLDMNLSSIVFTAVGIRLRRRGGVRNVARTLQLHQAAARREQ